MLAIEQHVAAQDGIADNFWRENHRNGTRSKFQNDLQDISENFGYAYTLAQANRIICDFETSLFSNNILFRYSVEVPPTTRKSPLLRK